VAPSLAHDTAGTLEAAKALHERIGAPNLYVKIPGTLAGLDAIRDAVTAGINVNVTLLFGLERYDRVIEAYLSGLEAREGPIDQITGVASFFVSRVDAEIDKRLEAIGTDAALALRGKAAVANAQLAYQLFTERFSGERWDALAARGARLQRPLWASTSTKNPDYPETLYVDTLIAPDTVNTMPENTLEAFDRSGTLGRTADADLDGARAVIDGLAGVGVDLDDVTAQLEVEGVASFVSAFDDLIATLSTKATSSVTSFGVEA
jgi:transaldolase